MAFALYIFSEGKWTESKILSQKNIALIIDPQADLNLGRVADFSARSI